jgi:eukaryotic-like serine/threonine-protein kinase
MVAPARLVAGRYRLRSLLGRGGMSRVWLAEDEVLRRPVAIKQVMLSGSEPVDERAAIRTRALREARAAARVHHMGAVTVYDVVEDAGLVWIVLEPLAGRTLDQAVDADGPLPVGKVARLGLRLLDVLQAIHESGVVHHDVKPGNVFLCNDGRVVLTDFGIACTPGDESTVQSNEFVGSPAYVAPERIRGDDLEPASDLFSLGATLFTAVEGTPPFRTAGSPIATMIAVLEDEPRPFRCSGQLYSVIEGLLEKDPARRLKVDAARAALLAVQSGAENSQAIATPDRVFGSAMAARARAPSAG